MSFIDEILLPDKLEPIVKEVVEALKPHKLTVTEVRQVLSYINKTIDDNVFLE